MNYCGMDVAMKSSYIYILDERGRKKSSGAVQTTYIGISRRLGRFIRGGLKVAIEAGNQTAWIHDLLVKLGAKVVVVNPGRVRLIAESRCKTDKIDARTLAELLRLDGLPEPVHMPCKKTRELRGLLVARRQLVSARTKLCNVVRGILRQEGVSLPSRYLNTYTGRERLLEVEFSHDHLEPILESYYKSYVSLTGSIQAMDKHLCQRELNDDRVERLKTIPKVGRIASLTLLSAVDDIDRFKTTRKFVSYSGLCPSVRSSGDRTEYGSINRVGRSELRAVWVQIAHLVACDKSRSTARLRRWYSKVAYHRGKKTAIVALARKLLSIAYRVLKDDTNYCSSLVCMAA